MSGAVAAAVLLLTELSRSRQYCRLPAGHTWGSWQQHCAAAPRRGRLTPVEAHPQLQCRAASGGGGNVAPGSSSPPPQHQLQDTIRESRQQQLAATDLLAKLLQSEDPRAVAAEWVGSLDEQVCWWGVEGGWGAGAGTRWAEWCFVGDDWVRKAPSALPLHTHRELHWPPQSLTPTPHHFS